MTAQNDKHTFAYQEQQLLNEGFNCELLHHAGSRYKSDKEYAIIYYLGMGKGFKTERYDIIAEA